MSMELIPQLAIIEIENLRLRAYIGFMSWEKEKLQDVIISYSFKYDTKLATKTDDVAYAVDYKKITKKIVTLIENQSYQLIESMAEKIYGVIQSFSVAIQDIEVKVEKPHALRFADNVLVKISGADRYNKAMIALGSNIHPNENIAKATSLLEPLGLIIRRTKFVVTKPLKFENQADFLNGAILLLTQKSLPLLQLQLKQIEAMLGRVRSENKNAPREIDLDITTFNGFIVDKDIQELPFLLDFVNELQPEILREA
ncbi:MAG TPA: dihydroneopterin aldolase [Niabella sp.]|nr:dihydroneopterin aldolase [Niabella sp.]HOZ98391.1 dihydroneopterin aldolase [Niabella sp.]HQW16350.1 dihydroneopterin aldolase [Niabella sp.]HQX21603.1 dihydroneopterin aldolase [Niabella sp.]HQX41979.1 dihydroneopterin aldolase [Niabella sp.]